MAAYRDRSQSISFIYANPLDLLKSIKEESSSAPAIRFDLRAHPLTSSLMQTAQSQATVEAMDRLKTNLSKLEAMQTKIRFMLGELERTTKYKRK